MHGLRDRTRIFCTIVGRLSSCATIHRRSWDGPLNSKRPVEDRPQDESCPTIAQVILARPLSNVRSNHASNGAVPVVGSDIKGRSRDPHVPVTSNPDSHAIADREFTLGALATPLDSRQK